MASRTLLPQYLGSFNEVDCIVVMLWHSSCDGENVNIKDNVLWWETNLVNKNLVGSLANSNLVISCGSLTFFVEGHYDHCCTVDHDGPCLAFELLFTTFEWDAVDNAFTLAVLESGFNNLKLWRINHNGHFSNIRIRQCHPHEPSHCFLSINETVIKVEVQYLSTIFYLIFSNSDGLVILVCLDEFLKLGTSRNVASLSNVDERDVLLEDELLHTWKVHFITSCGNLSSWNFLDWFPKCLDVVRCGTTTSTDHVDQSVIAELFAVNGKVLWCLIISTHGIR